MKLLAASFLICVSLVVSGCASTGATDVKTQKLVVANQLLQRFEELQDTVTDLYSQQAISPEHALIYSKFIVSATKTVKTVPDGWTSTIKQSWAEVKTLVPIDKMEVRVQFTAKLIDTLVGSL